MFGRSHLVWAALLVAAVTVLAPWASAHVGAQAPTSPGSPPTGSMLQGLPVPPRSGTAHVAPALSGSRLATEQHLVDEVRASGAAGRYAFLPNLDPQVTRMRPGQHAALPVLPRAGRHRGVRCGEHDGDAPAEMSQLPPASMADFR